MKIYHFAVLFRYFRFTHQIFLNRLSCSLLLLFVVYCLLIKVDWCLVKNWFWFALWITIEWYLVFVLFFGRCLMLVGFELCVCVLVLILPIFVSIDAPRIRCGVSRCRTHVDVGHAARVGV